ncbi:MAG TPA: tetratricopeptide repeat protein [Methanomicrobiales archaeon]|nr:tetratricopeptide repeat protein [Methanomicrobiales archaeon]
MRSPFRLAGVLTAILIPLIAMGGSAGAMAGGSLQPAPAGASGATGQPGPFFPNVSFTGQTLAAEDWYEQGFALTNEGQYSEAILAYGKALSLNRSLLNAWYYTGDAYFRLGQYSEAILAFSNATAVDPDFVDAYFYEGLVYEKLGRYQDRKDALQRGLEAADREEAAKIANAHPAATSPGSFPVSLPLEVPLLGAVLGAWAILRRDGNP